MSDDDFGVSPVIGVVLLVALVVILAGVVGIVFFDIGSQDRNPGLQSGLVTDIEETPDGVEVSTLESGSGGQILVDGEPVRNISENDTGETFVLDNVSQGSTVAVKPNESEDITQTEKVSKNYSGGSGGSSLLYQIETPSEFSSAVNRSVAVSFSSPGLVSSHSDSGKVSFYEVMNETSDTYDVDRVMIGYDKQSGDKINMTVNMINSSKVEVTTIFSATELPDGQRFYNYSVGEAANNTTIMLGFKDENSDGTYPVIDNISVYGEKLNQNNNDSDENNESDDNLEVVNMSIATQSEWEQGSIDGPGKIGSLMIEQDVKLPMAKEFCCSGLSEEDKENVKSIKKLENGNYVVHTNDFSPSFIVSNNSTVREIITGSSSGGSVVINETHDEIHFTVNGTYDYNGNKITSPEGDYDNIGKILIQDNFYVSDTGPGADDYDNDVVSYYGNGTVIDTLSIGNDGVGEPEVYDVTEGRDGGLYINSALGLFKYNLNNSGYFVKVWENRTSEIGSKTNYIIDSPGADEQYIYVYENGGGSLSKINRDNGKIKWNTTLGDFGFKNTNDIRVSQNGEYIIYNDEVSQDEKTKFTKVDLDTGQKSEYDTFDKEIYSLSGKYINNMWVRYNDWEIPYLVKVDLSEDEYGMNKSRVNYNSKLFKFDENVTLKNATFEYEEPEETMNIGYMVFVSNRTFDRETVSLDDMTGFHSNFNNFGTTRNNGRVSVTNNISDEEVSSFGSKEGDYIMIRVSLQYEKAYSDFAPKSHSISVRGLK
jgi:FlaG/FlaF family flagellin (archaellin)